MEVIGRGERVQLGMYQGKEARKNLFREKSALCSLGGGRNKCRFVLFFFPNRCGEKDGRHWH